ncbi:hypothetical protein O6H91_16G004200 [Diphasiastrum complanatum]|nr:hypothetical protein O6H91_16G004200 [Diphasiastrum complanatum]
MALLVAWLSAQKTLTDMDVRKIWKGLFYCVWRTDKAVLQADLIERLASLLLRLDVKLSLQVFEGFLSAMSREWGGIDILRLDKFYLLISKVLVNVFKILNSQKWDEKCVKKFMTAMAERGFLASDHFPSQGVNLHLADSFWAELKPFLPIPQQAFGCLLEPFYSALVQASDKILLERVKESVFMPLLREASNVQSSTEKECLGSKLGVLALGEPLIERFFELASSTVAQGNRKILYKLYEESNKLQKRHVVTEGFVSSTEQLNLKDKPIVEGVDADAKRNPLMSKNKKRKVENASSSKKKHRVGSAAKALKEDICNVLTPSGAMTVQEDMHLSLSDKEQLANLEDCTLLTKKCIGKEKQASAELHSRKKTMKEEPDLENSSRPRSLEKQKSLVRNSGQKVLGNRMEVTASNGHLDQSICRSNGSDLKSANGDLGECKEAIEAGDGMDAADPVVSNLSKRFNFSASDGPEGSPSVSFRAFSQLVPSPRNTGSKKRKKTESEKRSCGSDKEDEASRLSPFVGEDKQEMNGKKVRKVRFSLENNLVWKPKGPLPPKSLRLPPSSTPRGSALKKGVPPGPVRSIVTPKKLMKKVSLRKLFSDSSVISPWILSCKRGPLFMKRLNSL